jgi:hypothetical protein
VPPCEATIVQVPAAAKEAVEPVTEQTELGDAVYVTARPELAEAVNVSDVPTVWAAMGLKVMVCVPALTVKLCVAGVAAAYWPPPGCDAVMVQVPWAINVAVVPETIQTEGVVEAKLTVRPVAVPPELTDVALNVSVVPAV